MLSTPGSRLRAARTQLGFTQQGVADMLNQSVHTIKRWEQNRARPRTHQMLLKVCRVLGISVEHYLTGCPNMLLEPDEQDLLEKFRQLTPEYRSAILLMARGLVRE